ncbi:MAG: sulfur carrier protein ThiS [Deferribacterales bacterium]
MKVRLNGKDIEINENITVAELLGILKLSDKNVVVEINMNIIPKEDYANIIIQENDKLEIIHFVGGG